MTGCLGINSSGERSPKGEGGFAWVDMIMTSA
jgi:hypothetical protein